MMIFKIQQGGVIRGGTLEVEFNDIGDVYDVTYWLDVKCGQKVFGKWVPLPGFSKNGSARAPKDLLAEAFVSKVDNFEYGGTTFVRVDHLVTFDDGDVTGVIEVGFDGRDPVDILAVTVDWEGNSIRAVAE